MTMTMTRGRESTWVGPRLLVAFELSERTWKLGFTTGHEQRPRLRSVPAGAVDRLLDEVRRANVRWGLPPEAPVLSCYEAGREGFWLHRWAVAQGWTNYVVDSSSIEVNRRARRAKTDRLDLAGLLRLLARHADGEDRVWRVVRVPSEGEEDGRHLHRRETLQQERTRRINRLHGLLTTQGVEVPPSRPVPASIMTAGSRQDPVQRLFAAVLLPTDTEDAADEAATGLLAGDLLPRAHVELELGVEPGGEILDNRLGPLPPLLRHLTAALSRGRCSTRR